MHPHNHALVNRDSRLNECGTPSLGIEQAVGHCQSTLRGNQDSSQAILNLAGHRFIPNKLAAADPVAPGCPQEERPEANQAPRWYPILKANIADAVVAHVYQLGQPAGQILGQRADELLSSIDDQLLIRFMDPTINHFGHRFRLGNLELVSFPPHCLHQYRQVQLAPARNQELIGSVGGFHSQTHVGAQFPHQPFVQIAGGAVGSLLAHQRRGVDPEGHLDRWLFYFDCRKRLRTFRGRYGIADTQIADSGNGDDVAHLRLGNFPALQAMKNEDLFQGVVAHRTFPISRPANTNYRDPGYQVAPGDPPDTNLTQVIVVVQRRHQHLKRAIPIA